MKIVLVLVMTGENKKLFLKKCFIQNLRLDDECKKEKNILQNRKKHMLDIMEYAQSMECSNFMSLKN